MAVKEFEFGPQDYFEADYMSGDYTAPGIVRSLLQCDIEQIYGGVVLTGEYYEGEYIDGTYFHDNSIKATFACDATRAIGFEVGITDYFVEDYFEDSGYAETRGSEFSLSAQGGILQEAQVDFGALFTPNMNVNAIKNSFSLMDAVFTPNVDVNATFASEVTLSNIINQSLMGTRVRYYDSSPSSTSFFDLTSYTLYRNADATISSTAVTTTNSTKTTDINATLDTNVTISCEGSNVVFAGATFDSEFALTARPISYVLENRDTIEIYDTHNSWTTNSTVTSPSQFGNGSAFFDTTDNFGIWGHQGYVGKASNIIYDGTDYMFVTSEGKTYTSSDFTDSSSWTQTSNDLMSVLSGFDVNDWVDHELAFEQTKDAGGTYDYYVFRFRYGSTNDSYYSVYSTNGTNWYYSNGGLGYLYPKPFTNGNISWHAITALRENSTQVVARRASTNLSSGNGTTWYNNNLFNADTDSGDFYPLARHWNDIANGISWIAVQAEKEIWILKGTSTTSYTNVAQISHSQEPSDEDRIVDYLYDGSRHVLVTKSAIWISSNSTSWSKWIDYGTAGDRITGFAHDGSGNFLVAQDDSDSVKGITLKYGSYSSGLSNVSIPDTFAGGYWRHSQSSYFNTLTYLNNKFVYTNNMSYVAGFTYDGTNIETFDTPHPNPFIKLRNTSGSLSNFKTLDFWTKQGDDSQSGVLEIYGGNNISYIWISGNDQVSGYQRYQLLWRDTSGNVYRPNYQTPGYSGTGFNGYAVVSGSTNDWNHHRIIQDEGKVSYYINGERVFSQSLTIDTTIDTITFGAHNPVDQIYLDELYISSIAENDPDDTSITVPTARWFGDENTVALLHFDGTVENDTSLTFDIELDLAHTSTLTATANTVLDADTIHLGIFTLQADVTAVGGVNADIVSDFAVSADGIIVVTMSSATHSSAFGITVDNQIVRTVDGSFNSITNTTATATRIKPLDADFDSIATTINVINKIGNTLVDFTPGVFSTTVSADRFRGIVGIDPGVFEVSATATHIKAFEIDPINVVSTVDADVNYRPDIYMDNEGLGTVEADVNVIRGAEGNFECEINVTPTTRGIIGFNIDLTSATAQTVVGVKKVTVDSNLSGVANQTSIAVKTVDIDAELDSNYVLTTVTSRTRDVETEFDSIASQASAVAKIGDFLITLESAFTIEVEVTKTSGVGGILDSVATIQATPFRLIDREIDPVDSEFNTIIYGTKGTDTTSNISSNTDVEADINVVVVGEADISDAVSFAITVKATRTGDIDADSNFSLSAQTAQARTRATTVDVDSVSEFEAAVSKTVDVDIATQSSVAINITAKVIVVDAITFKIPKEYRVFQINKEDREHQVQFEQRETTIGA